MDFILVSDALTASETRYALAERCTMGAKVGSFPVLLETLAELWLIEPSELDWDAALQEQALAMGDAFWAQSIRVDEPTTVAEIKASIQFLLNYIPLGLQPVEIAEPGNRYERYYNDLVRLLARIGERPAQDQLAEQWLAEHQELSIESLYVYPRLNTEQLYPWQQEVLDILVEKGWMQPEPDKYYFIQESAPEDDTAPIQRFAKTLFRLKTDTIPNESLYWLTCRDHVQEVEAATSLIQSAIEQGTLPERIAVVVPRGGDYEPWLEKHLEYAGIIASNVRPESGVFDWQAALIHDLLTSLVQRDIPMVRMSVMINPLMPWSADIGHQLAEQLAAGAELRLGIKLDAEGEAMLDLLQRQPVETSSAALDWLNAIAGQCRTLLIKSLGNQRFKSLLENTRRLFALYEGQSFDEQVAQVIRQSPVAALKSQEDRIRYLHAVNIIQEGEPLPFRVDELFVLGFNQGHYGYQPEQTGPIHRNAWDQLAGKAGLAIPSVEASQQHWQQEFSELLRRVDNRITFLRGMNDHQGASLEPSDSLLDMALCFQPLKKLAPEQLEQPLLKSCHPLLRTETIELRVPDASKLDDLRFDQQILQGVRTKKDGSEKPESPSSLEKLMQSPLAWLLNRLGIQSRVWEPQAPDIQVQGIVAHKVFELFADRQAEPWSDALFDELFSRAVDQDAPFLDAAQWRLKRTQLRNKVYKAINDFASWCQQENWRISEKELALQGELWNIQLKGFVDAVLTNGNQTLIVDYKTSKHDRRLKQLEAGYDLQTLIYRQLYEQKNPGNTVMSGYYTLNDSTLLADRSLNPSSQMAIVQPELSLDDQSANAVALVKDRLKDLKSGTIKLNQTSDEKTWSDRGIKAYALTDNRVVSRFTRPSEEESA